MTRVEKLAAGIRFVRLAERHDLSTGVSQGGVEFELRPGEMLPETIADVLNIIDADVAGRPALALAVAPIRHDALAKSEVGRAVAVVRALAKHNHADAKAWATRRKPVEVP